MRACRGARFHSLLSLSGDGYGEEEGRGGGGFIAFFIVCVLEMGGYVLVYIRIYNGDVWLEA